MTPLQVRLRYLLSTLSVLLVLVLIAAAWGWWRIRASLPQLDGTHALAGLNAPVKVERDSLGVPTFDGKTRADVARATGFVHAQDRFFQMDILRRTGAGELSEIFGPATLDVDRAHRLHGFRRTARKVLAALPEPQRAVLDAYTTGVNAALATSSKKSWEYVALRTDPAPWRPEDSLLVIYAMWFDLQDATARYEQSIRALRLSLGQTGLDFFAPLGDSWDAALDGSVFPPAPLPAFHLKAADPATTASISPASEPRFLPGSNAFAVDGAHSASGSAVLANDMHLGLSVPNIWYRAVLRWTEANGAAHQVAGVTLPGLPAIIAGSNGHIAWGETNSYVDTTDIVLVEPDDIAQAFYRTSHGWTEIEDRSEPIKVKGKDAVPFTVRWTEWGPIIGNLQDHRYPVLRWNAHDVVSTNLNFMELETARTADEAVNIAHRAGMPNQNLVVADKTGPIAWTITGTIPRRVGYDGRQPVSWAYGDRKWDGWLKPEEIPFVEIASQGTDSRTSAGSDITSPTLAKDGIIWTANQRLVGSAELAYLGDNGYDEGARGGQIRDSLRQLVAAGRKATPVNLLAIELDDRAVYLERWQKVLLAVLSDEAVAKNRLRAEMRDVVRQWDGHAGINSAAYRLVQLFHTKLAERAFAPFFENARASYPDFDYGQFHCDDALWRLIQEKPARLLNPVNKSWEELMLEAADDVIAEVDHSGLPMQGFTWGARNTLRMQHPLSHFLPHFLGQFLDMPDDPLPGDNDMPRVQARDFGASERMVVSPGHEKDGIFHMPGGQSGNPLSPYYRAGHEAWVKGDPTPFLPGPAQHTLILQP